jgi:hypothetical protein
MKTTVLVVAEIEYPSGSTPEAAAARCLHDPRRWPGGLALADPGLFGLYWPRDQRTDLHALALRRSLASGCRSLATGIPVVTADAAFERAVWAHAGKAPAPGGPGRPDDRMVYDYLAAHPDLLTPPDLSEGKTKEGPKE